MAPSSLKWTFNTVVENYNKMRPGYVQELYADIFAYHPIHTESNVLEIGIGSGQATAPFLQTGCTLTAVEYGTELAQLCRQKFADYPRFP